MDKLIALAEFEKIAEREKLDDVEFRLFLILLANCDGLSGCGEVQPLTIESVFGNNFFSTGFDRACARLAALGLIEVVSSQAERIDDGKSVLVYRIQCTTDTES